MAGVSAVAVAGVLVEFGPAVREGFEGGAAAAVGAEEDVVVGAPLGVGRGLVAEGVEVEDGAKFSPGALLGFFDAFEAVAVGFGEGLLDGVADAPEGEWVFARELVEGLGDVEDQVDDPGFGFLASEVVYSDTPVHRFQVRALPPKEREMDVEDYARVLEAIAHPVRLTILEVLREQPTLALAEIRKEVSERYMETDHRNVEFHLTKMQFCGVVRLGVEGGRKMATLLVDVTMPRVKKL